jgi:uncharacterized membrane protein YphA (DoxX/SURF4 family)
LAVAHFLGHASSGFHPVQNGGEFAILFCFVFLNFAAAGQGRGMPTPSALNGLTTELELAGNFPAIFSFGD